MSKIRRGKVCLVVAAAAIVLLAEAREARASHFRYGTISWSVPDPLQPRRIQFRVSSAWRRSYPCAVGQAPPGCAPWGLNHFPNVGEVINLDLGVALQFDFGDGTAPVNMTGATVTAISATEDWLVAEWTMVHVYGGASTAFLAFISDCCRISTLQDGNNDDPFRLESRVTIGGNRPPATSSLPSITLDAGQPITFAIPASDPDGDALSFVFSSASAASVPPAGSSGLQTAHPAGLTMTAGGVIAWTPPALPAGVTERLYALQIRITDPFNAFTTLDVVLRVVDLPSGNPPTVTINGSSTPVTISIIPNQPASATITVNDPDPDPGTGVPPTLVTLNTGGRPGGSSVVPGLPHQALVPYSVTFSWTPTFGDQGSHTIVFGATDNTGRPGSNALHIIVENQPPVNVCAMPQTLEAVSSSGASATVSAEVGDPDGDPVTVKWFIDGVQVRTDTLPSGPPPTSAMLDLTHVFGLGIHAVHVEVADDHAHVTNCDTTVTVQDTTAPTFAAPPSQIIEALSSAGAPASWATPVASDAADPSVPVVCTPASDTLFPLGSHTVECSATDDSGNQALAQFSIDVVDTTPPVLSLPGTLTAESTSPAGAAVTWPASASDLVDGSVAVVCTPSSGHTFPIGDTAVVCTASDARHNEATGGFLVTVFDATPPTIGSVTPSSAMLWPPNHKLEPVSFDVAAADESGAPVCSIEAVSSNEPQEGLGDGDTPVDWMVTGPLSVDLRAERSGRGNGRAYTVRVRCVDASGNTSTATAAVMVPNSMGQ